MTSSLIRLHARALFLLHLSLRLNQASVVRPAWLADPFLISLINSLSLILAPPSLS